MYKNMEVAAGAESSGVAMMMNVLMHAGRLRPKAGGGSLCAPMAN